MGCRPAPSLPIEETAGPPPRRALAPSSSPASRVRQRRIVVVCQHPLEVGAPGTCCCCCCFNPATQAFQEGQQAAWRMRCRSWAGHPHTRRQPQITQCLLLRALLRRAGPPAEARLRCPFDSSAPMQAESCNFVAERKSVGAGAPFSRLCAPLTRVFESGSTPGVARRRATTGVWPLQAAVCRGVQPSCRGGVGWAQGSAGGHRVALWAAGVRRGLPRPHRNQGEFRPP